MKSNKQEQLKHLLLITIVFIHTVASAQYNAQSYSVKTQFTSNKPFSYFEISFDGDIQTTRDDQNIRKMSSGSYLIISRSSFGYKRKLELRGLENGTIQRRYFEGRIEQPYEPDGRDWLTGIMLEVLRITGIDAKNRVDRFYINSGIEGVLDEISEIESNSIKSMYFDALADKNLSNRDLIKMALEISTSISSSSERGRLYRRYSRLFLANDEVSSSYFKGVSRIASNTEVGFILSSVLERDLSETQIKGVLKVVESLSSSTEKGSVLRLVNSSNIEKMNLADEYFDAVNSISSSSEKGHVLKNLLTEVSLSEEMLRELYISVGQMSSSTEMGSVLKTAVKISKITNRINDAFFSAIDEISSDSEKGSVLRALIQVGELTTSTKRMLIESSGTISSDSEKARVLRDAIVFMDNTDEINDVYFEEVEDISSNTEISSVLRALLNTRKLNDISLIPLFQATESMSSSTEKGRTIVTALKTYKLSDNAIITLLDAIEDISSDTEKGRCLRLLVLQLPKNNSHVIRAFKDVARTLSSDYEYRTVMDTLIE